MNINMVKGRGSQRLLNCIVIFNFRGRGIGLKTTSWKPCTLYHLIDHIIRIYIV